MCFDRVKQKQPHEAKNSFGLFQEGLAAFFKQKWATKTFGSNIGDLNKDPDLATFLSLQLIRKWRESLSNYELTDIIIFYGE